MATICEELEIESSPAGSVLFRRDDLERGVMPDRAYYFEHIGALNEVTETVDLRRYPPPDLVLEVVWSHGPKEALEILSELKVPEVWVYEIPEERLQFLQLDGHGSYVPQPRSRSFPFLEPEDVLGQLRSAVQGEPYFRWKRRLRDWVRGTLAPRRTEGK